MVMEMKLVVSQPQNQVFFPGSEVSGSLVIEADTPKSYNYIQVVLDGRAYVHWSESIRAGESQRTVSFSETEVFANATVMVWEKSQAPGGVLQPGRYNFPFRFVLPPRLPPSFEGGVGYIRYQVQVRIGTGAFDHVLTHQFAVSEAVDAANSPTLQHPLQAVTKKTICCLCCASGPITTRAQVERSGFCVGDSIPVTVEIENGSGRRLTVSVNLYQNIVFYAQGRTCVTSKLLAGISGDAIPAHTTRTWNPGDSLKIPQTNPSLSPPSCSIIRITYVLKVSTIVPGSISVNATIPNIPIVIGNVPSRSRNQAPASLFLPDLPPQPPAAPVFSQPLPPAPIGFAVPPKCPLWEVTQPPCTSNV